MNCEVVSGKPALVKAKTQGILSKNNPLLRNKAVEIEASGMGIL